VVRVDLQHKEHLLQGQLILEMVLLVVVVDIQEVRLLQVLMEDQE
jgi:hypothetical protein